MTFKTILIRLDANHEKGMGHLYRMMSLAKMLTAESIQVFFIVKQNQITQQVLKKNKYRFIDFEPESDEEIIVEEALSQCSEKPSLWIYDVLDTQAHWYRPLQEKQIPAVSFDDTAAGIIHAHMVFNPIAACWGGRVKSQYRHVFNGPGYMILQKSLLPYRKMRKIQNSNRLKIGISLGGSDTHGYTIKAADALHTLELKGNQSLHFFLGPHFRHEAELNRILPAFKIKVFVNKSIDNLFEKLDQMDVVICNGGITLYEVCAMGLPALGIANEPHEAKTLEFFQQNGAAILLANETAETSLIREKLYENLFDISHLNGIAGNGYRLVDGNGLERVYEKISSLLE